MQQRFRKNDEIKGYGELKRLLQFIVKYPDDWECICDMDFFDVSVERRLEIIEHLEMMGVWSAAYIVFHLAGSKSREMEMVRNQLAHEIMANVSVVNLTDQMKMVMKHFIKQR